MPNSYVEKIKGQADNLPNKFSIALGELIRTARIDAGLSQSDLAENAYLSQAAVSQIEKGKRSVSVEELIYLSKVLNKPIMYFFPKDIIGGNASLTSSDLSLLEIELLTQARRLSTIDVNRLIVQVRALADFNL